MSFDYNTPIPRNNVYPVDSTIQQLDVNSFSDKFDIKDFVGAISEKLIAQSKAASGPFDPKPFIRNFESAVDTLIQIRKDVQRTTEQQEQSSKTAEKEYSRKLGDLNRGFESVGKSFNGMESKITEVGRTAVRIGEQLESVHLARQRAQAAHDIVSYWNQFSRGDTSKIEALRKEGREGRQAVAVLLRRLNTVAKDLDIAGADKTREELEKYCEKFEKDMLRTFDKSYRKGDPKMMKHCALTLLEFNGGASCIQIYVNQHDFFISKSRVNEENSIEETHLWEILPDPNMSLPKKDLDLAVLLEEVRTTVGQEATIIQAVFPNPPVVMQVFLLRVFEQSIQQHLEQLLNKAGSLSTLAFLRILQLAHVQISKLVQDLKLYDLSAAPLSRSNESTSLEVLDSRAGEGRGMGIALPIGIMLENAMEELFTPYIEGTKYLEKETKSLGELYAAHLARFAKYHEMVSKSIGVGQSGLLDRVVNRFAGGAAPGGSSLPAPTTASSAFSGFAKAKLSGMAMKLAAAGTSPAAPPSPQASPLDLTHGDTDLGGQRDSVSESDGMLSLDTAKKMLKWHAEAIGRCVELSGQSDIAKNIFAVSRVLAEAIGTAYMGVALESAQVRLEIRDARQEPDLSVMAVIRSVELICQLWQQYVTIALIPLASSSVTVRREMIIFNTETLSRIESGANALDQKILDTIIAWLTTQLLKQKKNDFRPKNDDDLFTQGGTEPCMLCCDMLEKVRDAAREHLSGLNRENFLTEVGVTFHSMLLEHLKKFPVSATGGLLLAKDLKAYQDTMSSFGIPALEERFEFIRQLGNVFLVRPDILKSYITEDELGRIDSKLLRPYLAQRSDWNQFGAEFEKEVFGGVVVEKRASRVAFAEMGMSSMSGAFGGSLSNDVKGLRDRLGVGKLSTMMKELEALRSTGGGAGGTKQTEGGTGYSIPSFSFGNT
ncbi:Exocyst complex component 5 [Tulasnella sp. JGI-2019a]|nr:Exocyst complex component 5 [Tulasnella sp. JGI-2019a]